MDIFAEGEKKKHYEHKYVYMGSVGLLLNL